MSLLQGLPFSLAHPGPDLVAGVGNYHLQILPPNCSIPAATIFLLDSHSAAANPTKTPDYEPIHHSQISWFTYLSRHLRESRRRHTSDGPPESANITPAYLALAFFHIPLPEFASADLVIQSGSRREPTEGPRVNTHFYDALAAEGVAAVGVGHDHVNDFCGFLPERGPKLGAQVGLDANSLSAFMDSGPQQRRKGPWLCHSGAAGFGGYGVYGGRYTHRRMRVWEIDTMTGGLDTWLRVEYEAARVEKTVLVEGRKS
jgi:hypothetical protein